MARVPYVDPATASPEIAAVLGRLPELHVFGLLAQAETAFRPWLGLGGALLRDLAIDPLLRELVIVAVGRHASPYVHDQHVPLAVAAGATAEQLAALDRGEHDAGCFTATQRAALDYVTDLVRDGEVSDGHHAALAAELDDRRLVEVALTAGHYLGLARILTALRVDPDPAGGLGAIRTGD